MGVVTAMRLNDKVRAPRPLLDLVLSTYAELTPDLILVMGFADLV